MKILFWMFIGFDRHATSEHLLSAVIEQLCRAGHSVHILQKDTGGDLPAIPGKLSGYPVTTDAIPYRAADKGNFIARYLTELKYVEACGKYIAPGFDAVFIQSNNVAGFALRTVRRKLPEAAVTFNVQDIFPYNLTFSGGLKRGSHVFKALAAVQRYGYRHADRIITISEDMRDTLIADGTPARKVEVVYNWSYQDQPYRDLDLAPVRGMLGTDRFNVVYAGNIGVMQNVDVVIEAARLMRDDPSVHFHIIGNGVYKEKLENRVGEYGLGNVSFWPMQPAETAPLIYSAADVNVIPLVKNVYKTALPSKTATCLACGRPVVFAIGKESRFGRRIAEEAGCPVIEPDDPAALAGEIRRIRRDGQQNGADRFFLRYCGITKNSGRYAEIITESDGR